MLQRFKASKYGTYGLYLSIFVFMLVLNIITPIYADDYSYVFHFSTGERLDSFFDIFPSLGAHAHSVNGRLIAHFFVHLFMMLPWAIFDIVNSAMFVFFIHLSSKIANVKGERDNFLPLIIFLFSFMFHDAFGQQFLWVAGACNYLWAMVAGLLFLLPLHNYMVFGKIMRPSQMAAYIPFGFVAGAFLENVSAGVIFTAVLYILASKFYLKQKIRPEAVASCVFACLGYLFMATCPGTLANKITGFDLEQKLDMAFVIFMKFVAVALPIALFAVLFFKSRKAGVSKSILASSVILLAGGAASNCVLIFAPFYPDRCAIGLVAMLICSIGMLYNASGGFPLARHIKKIACAYIAVWVVFFGFGFADIIATRIQFNENEEYIEKCKAVGILDVEVSLISPKTKYSAAMGINHLEKDPTLWPNFTIAKYYGLNTIKGKQE